MADKIYNISDYRKGAGGDTVDHIEIEDPLDFLDASEKEAYIRERHREENEKLRRREEEEKKSSETARGLSEEQRARIKRETDDPLAERPRRSVRPDPYAEEDRALADQAARGEEAYEDGDEEPEDDGEEDGDEGTYEDDGDDQGRGLLIASGILGILIVLMLVFLLWLRFFMPVPKEPEAEERVREEAQLAEEQAEAQDEPESGQEELAELLAEGFAARDDTVRITTALNMRSAPDSAQDNKVTTVAAGTRLHRVAENALTGWSAVEVPGYDDILYCATKYLETE